MGKSVGNFGCSMEKWGILGLKRSKKMVLIGNKAVCGGGGCIGEASDEKWGGIKPVHPSPTIFVNFCPHFLHFPWYWVHYAHIAGHITIHFVRVFLT